MNMLYLLFQHNFLDLFLFLYSLCCFYFAAKCFLCDQICMMNLRLQKNGIIRYLLLLLQMLGLRQLHRSSLHRHLRQLLLMNHFLLFLMFHLSLRFRFFHHILFVMYMGLFFHLVFEFLLQHMHILCLFLWYFFLDRHLFHWLSIYLYCSFLWLFDILNNQLDHHLLHLCLQLFVHNLAVLL